MGQAAGVSGGAIAGHGGLKSWTELAHKADRGQGRAPAAAGNAGIVANRRGRRYPARMAARTDDILKRLLDLAAAGAGLVALALPLLAVAAAVRLTSPGPAIYRSQRVGRDNRLFGMPKFRTMRVDTPEVATHLLEKPDRWVTPIGQFLRKTSLDELPQLWSVLRGDMTLVGPRPALFNQDDLVALRTEAGVHRLRPGVTGWAQVNGRDDLPIPVKVAFDRAYLERRSLAMDLKILWLTVAQVLGREGVSH